jgi:hypothetical protein
MRLTKVTQKTIPKTSNFKYLANEKEHIPVNRAIIEDIITNLPAFPILLYLIFYKSIYSTKFHNCAHSASFRCFSRLIGQTKTHSLARLLAMAGLILARVVDPVTAQQVVGIITGMGG